MKNFYARRALLLFTSFLLVKTALSQIGFSDSILKINVNGSDTLLTSSTFDGVHLGMYGNADSLVLGVAEVHTYVNASVGNICSSSVWYRIYKECEIPGAFTSLNLSYCCSNGDLDCESGACSVSPPTPGFTSQKWKTTSEINLLQSLSKGNYILEVYFSIEGSDISDTLCDQQLLSDNNGLYFQLSFSVGTDGFGGQLSNSNWEGDISFFSNTDPQSFSGDGSNPNIGTSGSLNNSVLVSELGATDRAIAMPSGQAYGIWEFSIATGMNWTTSSVNNFMIPFISSTGDPSNLIIDSGSGAPNFDGYALKLKNVAGDLDTFVLVKHTGTSEEELVDLQFPMAANVYDGCTIRILRSPDGAFRLYIDTGFDNTAPSTLRGTVIDNQHQSCSYFGVVLNANDAGPTRRLYFDNLLMAQPTVVRLSESTADISETNASYSYPLTIQISNPDDRCATVGSIKLISGDSSRIDNFTTQTFSFSPGDTSDLILPITISANMDCQRNEKLVFELQDVSGGFYGFANGQTQHLIHLDDDESGSSIDLHADFESGEFGRWTNTDNWTVINSQGTIDGSFDLKHNVTGLASMDHVTVDLNDLELEGAETTWRFDMKHAGFNTSANNWLMMVICSNQENVWDGFNISNTLDGYAVGVNFNTSTDNLRLVRIDDGNFTDLISSSYIWDTNVVLGIEIVLDDLGNWEFKYKENGGFTNMISAGVVNDQSYTRADFLNFAVELTSGNAGKPRIDNVSVGQYGCFEDWYTTNSGTSSSPIWSQDSTAVLGEFLQAGRFKNLHIQQGHEVTLDQNLIAHDFLLSDSSTCHAGNNDLTIHHEILLDGSFVADSSLVRFIQNGGGMLAGNGPVTLHNLEIAGSGPVIQSCPLNLVGALYPTSGVLETNGQSLVLLSDDVGTSSIAAFNDNSSIQGQVTLQRYIPPGDEAWFNLGNPMVGATFEQWNDDLTTTGFSGSDWPGWNFVNIQSYDETVPGILDDGFVPVGAITDEISSENGYLVYVEGAAQNVDVTGEIHLGSLAQDLTYTPNESPADDGWHLVVNRYPSAIDWNLIYQNSEGISSTYHVHDGDGYDGNRNYLYYDAMSGAGPASRNIASSQSFWVKVEDGGGTLNWEEEIKTQATAPFERGMLFLPQINLRLVGETSADHTTLLFDEEMSAGFDELRDAFHLGSNSPVNENSGSQSLGISTLTIDEHYLSVNNLPWNALEIGIPVYLSVPDSQLVTFKVSDLTGMPTSVCLTIEDTETSEVFLLDEDLEITIPFTEAFSGIRFIIQGNQPLQSITTDVTCPEASDGSISLSLPGYNDLVFSWYDELDNEIVSNEVTATSILDNISFGNYLVIVEGTDLLCDSITQVFTVDQPQPLQFATEFEPSSCMGSDGWIGLQPQNDSPFTIGLIDGEGNSLYLGDHSSELMYFDSLYPGNYTTSIATSCESMSFSFNLLDTLAVSASLICSTDSLYLGNGPTLVEAVALTTGADSLSWYLDGEWLSSEAEVELSFTDPGDYLLALIAERGFCEDIDSKVIHVLSENSINYDEQQVLSIQIQPNSISFEVPQQMASARVEVFNSIGQLVSQIQSLDPGRNTLSTRSLSPGIYYVVLTQNRQVLSSRFLR